MKELTDSKWIKIKGALFLLLGLLACGLLLAEHPSWKVAFLLALAIWAFCRFYYFAFYVLERYVDPAFKFSGLGALVHYLCKREK